MQHCCRVPLKQLEARYSIRAARPQGETVDDEVHYALAQEAAQLSGFCAQLAQRVDAADTQVAHLDDLSAALLSNIADKEAAMTLEEKIALLDGRMYPAVPPTPSVLSVSVDQQSTELLLFRESLCCGSFADMMSVSQTHLQQAYT